MQQNKTIPLCFSQSLDKKERKTIIRPTPAMSPISMASVFSISSSLWFSSSTLFKFNTKIKQHFKIIIKNCCSITLNEICGPVVIFRTVCAIYNALFTCNVWEFMLSSQNLEVTISKLLSLGCNCYLNQRIYFILLFRHLLGEMINTRYHFMDCYCSLDTYVSSLIQSGAFICKHMLLEKTLSFAFPQS